jgi:hypothetical protein
MLTVPLTFPDLNFDAPPPGKFALTFKPKSLLRASQSHRLAVPPNHEMRRLREELTREAEQFSRRLRQMGLV